MLESVRTAPMRGWLLPALALLLAAVCITAPLKSTANLYDEGTYLVSAEHILHGDTPYRDFFFFKPPGQIYVLAALFRTFGATVRTGRVYDVIVRLALACGAGLIGARQMGIRRAALVTLVVAILIAADGAAIYPIYVALLLALLALGLLTRPPVLKRSTLAAAGALVGLTVLMRWDFGVYAGLACAAAVALRPGDAGLRPLGARRRGADVALLAAAAAGVALLLFGLVALRSGLRPLLDQVFVFPATVQPDYRWRAYPGPWLPHVLSAAWPDGLVATGLALRGWLGFYLPILIYGAILVRFAGQAWRRELKLDAARWKALSLAIFGALLLLQALNRYDIVHVLPSLVVLVPLLALQASSGCRPLRFACPRGHALTRVVGAGVAVVFLLPPLVRIANDLRLTPPIGCYSSLPRAGCVKVDDDLERAVLALQARTTPSQPTFVALQRHDMIFVSDMLFYFLSDRRSLTRYQLLEPGLATTAVAQQTIVADLAAHAAQAIVLVDMPLPAHPETNLSSVSSRVFTLDTFIRTHYAPEATFGMWSVWRPLQQTGVNNRIPGS